MQYRHLVTKGFDWGIISKSIILDSSHVFTKVERRYGKIDREDYAVEVVKSFPDNISMSMNLKPIKGLISDSEKLSKLILDKNEVRSLDSMAKQKGFWEILSDDRISAKLRKTAVEMFPNTNPLTKDKDVVRADRNAQFYPIVILSGTLPPQLDEDGNSYFNPDGVVTVAEFLDSLNAIKNGSSSNVNRKKSLDNISDEKDFFNVGYQSCVSRISSPLFNLYTRRELLEPITRLELAYITVICWDNFKKKYGNVFGGKYLEGINIDWNNVEEILSDFDDGNNYKVSKMIIDDATSINIKDYLTSDMTSLKSEIKEGNVAIPYPMFMSLLELDTLHLFNFEDLRLDPLKEVSRSELSYFLVKLSSEV